MHYLVGCLFVLVLAPDRLAAEPAKEPRHLLVAKFTLERFDKLDLTAEQRVDFNRLSSELRTEIDALRKEAGITNEAMARRDEAHQKLRHLKLEEDDYWTRLQADAELIDTQLDAFRKTAVRYDTFKKDAVAILTTEQQAQLRKNRATKKKADRVNPQ